MVKKRTVRKVSKTIIFLILFYVIILLTVIYFKPNSYEYEKEFTPNFTNTTTGTDLFLCLKIDTYYYTITPQEVYRMINLGILDKKIYENFGIDVYGKIKIKEIVNPNLDFNAIIPRSSLNDKDYITLEEKYNRLGIVELNKRFPVFQKVCISKELGSSQFDTNVRIIYLFKENIYFSALKLFLSILIIRILWYIPKKIAKYLHNVWFRRSK